MILLPKPQNIEIKDGFLKSKAVTIQNLSDDYRIEKALDSLEKGCGAELTITHGSSDSEGYTLEIFENKILINGDSAAGAFFAIQTLKQIFENEEVPCLYIKDCPSMKYRGFYHDVTRGKVPTLETLKKLVDTLAYYKMNSLQIYVEHTFPFKELGNLIDSTGCLSAEETKELDDYCYDNFIELVPSIATFGHLYELLQIEEYQNLRCLDNFKNDQIFWCNRMAHHTIDPANEKSIEIIKSMLDQYVPLFRSDKFNICCDETFDLKNGKHKEEDTAKLYIDFVKQIIAHLEAKGKTIMMWGDILLQHPETISQLPKNTLFCNWAYDADPSEDSFKTFFDLNRTQITCPGTSSWSRLVEGIEVADQNITKMLDYGCKYNALGMLNTNWGDYGNPCSIELATHGLVLGAAKAWNIKTEPDDDFNACINALEYKNSDTVKYLKQLDHAHKSIGWNNLVHCFSNFTHTAKIDVIYPTKDELTNSISICTRIVDELSNQVWTRDNYRKQILIAAEGIWVMAELYARLADYDMARTSSTKHWLSQYRASWLESNKESELSKIEEMFNYLEKL